MNNALLYLGGLLAVVFAALFAVPHFVDWNGYRGVFEEEASKVLGRDVRVSGAVNVQFLPTPYVRFEKVRLADPTGQTGEPFVRVDSFTMRLSGPALLRGVLEANEIELQRPVLTLALDGKGGGNWSSVEIKAGALPFVPQDVALRSVKVVDGAVGFFNAESQPIARAEAVNGEFSADALKGPFKFKGQAKWSGQVREIKFATTVPETDGSFRVKASSRATNSAATYLLDGKIEDLAGTPRLTGELTGKLPLETAAAAPASEKTQPSEPPVLDLKARIDANTAGAKIEEIALALDNATEPQLISGAATAVWGQNQRLDIALNSKWLDLDKLAGAEQDGATFVKVKKLGLSSLGALAGGGDGIAAVKLEVDQVKLGGETAGGLKVDAERRGGAVRLTQLRAGLPGGSRLDLSGDLKDDNGKVRFAGSGFVHGSNLARLLSWAAKSGASLDVKADGPFTAEGRIVADDARFELTEASADIGGRPFSGDVAISGEGRRKVAVTLEAARLDSSELFPETSRALEDNLRRAFGLSSLAADKAAAPPSTAPAPDAKPAADAGDISIRVLAGELKHGTQIFRNVDATLGLDGGTIRIPSAKFTTASGLTASVEARIDNASNEPKGTLAYDFVARTHDAVNDFAVVTGLSSILPPDRLAKTDSAKLAGLIRFGARGGTTADVTVDGTVDTAQISGQAEFDSGLQTWRTAPSRLRLTAHAPALMPLLDAFGIDAGTLAAPGTHEAELVFAATGPLATGAAALADITAPGFEASYKGRIALAGDSPLFLAGAVRIKSDEALDVLAAAGIKGSRGLTGIAVDGAADVTRDGNAWRIVSKNLVAGGTALSGTVNLTANASGPAAIVADVLADVVTVPGLLAAITDQASPVAAGVPADVWPNGLFSNDALSILTGDVRVKFASLIVQEGLAAHNGTLNIALAPGKAAITSMSGTAAGGSLGGQIQLAKATSGVGLDGTVRIDNADLKQLAASGTGKATIDLKASAQAQSAAGLLTALTGTGTVALEGAHLPVPSAAAGANVVTGVITNKLANEPEAISETLRVATSAAVTDLGSRSIPFVVTGGVAKFDPIILDSTDGTSTGITVVDVTTLKLDSAWRVASMVPPLAAPAEPLQGWVAPPAKGTLPPASIVYTGQLADLKAVAVNVDATDMQRELAVRIVERNLEDLERLKLQDQQRARLELERRQAIEAERAAAIAAAAAAKAAAAAARQQTTPPAATALPPVLPESAGTAPPSATSVAPTTTSAVPAGNSPAANGTQPAQQGTITIEPDPQAAAASANPAPAVAPIVPAGETPPPAVRPQPARAPTPRPTQPRRTSADELRRSLGGYP
jgi:uncharacterized protein involved in outer membrane biogenesis